MVKFHLGFKNLAINTDESKSERDEIFTKLINEKKQQESGYYNLPYETKALQDSLAYMQHNSAVLKDLTHIVIIGIGGSSLGLKAQSVRFHL